MKTNQKLWTRVLSVALTVCMLLGFVAVPVAFAEEVEAEVTGTLSTPIYTNSMDQASEASAWYPTDWVRSSSAQFARGASIIVAENEGDRQYYQMKRNGKESAAITWATSNPIADYSAAVLKYEVMIDNTDDMAGWVVYLPSFAQSDKGRATDIQVGDYALANTDVVLTPGQWYTVEMALTGKDWVLYWDGEKVNEGTLAENLTISCLTMGIRHSGGNPAEGQSAGANVAFNIDNMEIYACAAATSFEFAATEYAVEMGSTVATAWNAAPANAYIPAVTYFSSDELVATVDANGVVTGVSAGTATITAIPAASSGMAAATTTVTVADADGLSNVNKAILSTPIYTNPMDEMASNKLYPLDWAKSSRAQNASASSIIPATAENARQYYQMKRKGTDGNAISWATVNPITDYSAAVLKYDVMIDNAEELAGWEVHLPSFSNDVRTRALPISVADYQIGKTELVLTPGQWYTFEVILNGTAWMLYVDGEKVLEEDIPAAQQTITCLNMGIANKGGNPAEGENAGANVAFNIDNMAIYSYAPATSIAYEQAEYSIAVGEKAAPALTLAPAGAYLPSVTYTSSDDTIATVSATGVVTAVAEGTVTITATPAPSSGLTPVTTAVTVGEETPDVPVGPETAADLVFLQAPSLSFQDYIGMQVMIYSSLKDNYDEIYVEAIQKDPTEGDIVTKLEGFLYYYDMFLVFDQQILSWSMAEEVTLTLYGVKDGVTYVGQSYTESVETLALAMLEGNANGGNAKLCTVLVDMLNYGAAVQVTFDHNATLLPNTQIADYAALGTAGVPAMDAEVVTEGTGAVTVYQNSISMQSKVELQLLFLQDVSAYTAKAVVNGEEKTVVMDTETMAAYGGTVLRVAVGASQMREIFTIALYDDAGVAVTTVYTVSVEAYAQMLIGGEQNDVAVTMMRYGDAVAAYAAG